MTLVIQKGSPPLQFDVSDSDLTDLIVTLAIRPNQTREAKEYACTVTGQTTFTFDPDEIANEPPGYCEYRIIYKDSDEHTLFDKRWSRGLITEKLK